ncbi:MAG: branched-chain amino acid ABC transporter permease [Acetobacteraceae bacterium]|nr:branched-chain amino acid ABC transporter permease [Acetobacteraceae bacterium]MBV8456046.1 branched-chain amino acid ABC transporter permease [Acetobacteraceae bacterium]
MQDGSITLSQLTKIGAALVLLVALTFVADPYRLFQLTMVIAYACAVLGLTILTGINGQISLGHGAFFAIGSYAAAILMANYNWPYWATLPVAAVSAGIFGFLIGFPALRLGGLYLALTTFALAVAVPQILKVNALEDLTGGVQGLTTDKPQTPFGLPLSNDQWIYLFTLAIGAIVFLLGWNLTRGRLGRAMKAIRDHGVAAEAMGIHLASVKTRTFAISAMFTGIGGALSTIAVQFVAPDSFSFQLSITLFVGLVVGGVDSILGAIFGGVFIEFVPNIANDISKAAPGAIYGLILIGFMFLMPRGVAGLFELAGRRLTRRQAAIASPPLAT